jgi:glycosyltransferase involved in cell wall biosynthesis
MTPAPLRILHLYPKDDYFTGAAVQVRELAGGLQARGHHVVVATRPSEVWTAKSREAGLLHHPLPMRSVADMRTVARLARIVRRHRIEIVHAHKGKARTLALLAGLFVRIPVLVLNRGVSFAPDRFTRLGYTTPRVAAIVAVSEFVKQELVAGGVPADKIHVVYSGTDTERFHPGVDGARVRRELGLAAEHFLITQIGVRSSKGNDDVLDAMAGVAARAPAARLLVVGARRPETIADKARARGLADLVRVWGYRDDVPEILRASDCCVDASHAGVGLTGSLREALAVETPAVGYAVAGNPELITDGETGLLVPPRDSAALAHAILKLVDDPGWRRELGRAGRRRVEARFSLRAKVDALEALYRHLRERARAA